MDIKNAVNMRKNTLEICPIICHVLCYIRCLLLQFTLCDKTTCCHIPEDDITCNRPLQDALCTYIFPRAEDYKPINHPQF